MTKLRSILTAALFTLVTANMYVFFTQSASAESASECSHSVKTTDTDKISPEEYFRLYQSG